PCKNGIWNKGLWGRPDFLRRRTCLLRDGPLAEAPAVRAGESIAHGLPDRPVPDHLLRHRLLRAAAARNRTGFHADLRKAARVAGARALELGADVDPFVEPVHFPGMVRIAAARELVAQLARAAVDV